MELVQYRDFLNESLDKFYPFAVNTESLASWVRAQYEFNVGSSTFALRVIKSFRPGTFAYQVLLGRLVSKKVSPKLVGVTNFKMFFSTLVNILLEIHDNPVPKLKTVFGMAIRIDADAYDKHKSLIVRAVRMKLKGKYRLMEGVSKDYIDDGSMKVLYIYQFGKTFKQVFDKLPSDFLDSVPDEGQDTTNPQPETDTLSSVAKPIEKAAPVLTTPSSVVSKGTEKEKDVSPTFKKVPVVVEPVTKPEPLSKTGDFKSFVKAPEDVKDDKKDPIDRVLSPLGSNLSEKDVAEGWKLYVARVLSNKFGKTDTYINGDKNKIITMMAALSSDGIKDRILPDVVALYVLNKAGIRTGHVYDFYNNGNTIYDTEWNKFLKKSVKSSKKRGYWNYIKSPKITDDSFPQDSRSINDVSYEELFKIYEGGLPLEVDITYKYYREPNDIDAFTALDNKVLESMSVEEKKDLFLSVAASMKRDKPNFSRKFKEDDDGGSKHIHFSEVFPGDNRSFSVNYLGDSLFNSMTSSQIDDFVQNMDPIFASCIDSGFYVNDLEHFKANWVSSWTIAGGSNAQDCAFAWVSEFGEHNTAEKPLWQGVKNIFSEKGISGNGLKNFSAIYAETQAFLKGKMKKKYDTKLITIYRGVGIPSSKVMNYVPGALESWTTQLGTASTFAKMMSDPRSKDGGTILYAEVPASAIWATYESLSGWFPAEKNLKGKKEHIVLGGVFAKYPIRVYNPKTKSPTDTLISFSEWKDTTMVTEQNRTEVEVIFTDDPSFNDIIADKNTVTGRKVEPEGDLVNTDDDEEE